MVDAEAFARKAVVLAMRMDSLNQPAKVLVDLAEVLRIADRAGEAHPIVQQAILLYEQKGNAAAAARTRRLLSAPDPASAGKSA